MHIWQSSTGMCMGYGNKVTHKVCKPLVSSGIGLKDYIWYSQISAPSPILTKI